MALNPLRSAAIACILAFAALPARAADYANPQLLTSADELRAVTEYSEVDMGVSYSEDTAVIDVRPVADYLESHIPGARHLAPNAVADPNSPVPGALRPAADLAVVFGNLGISPDTHVVLYDDKGGFHAARVFWLLEYYGHRKVSLLDGGIQKWVEAGYALDKGPRRKGQTRPAIALFSPAITPRRHASADYIIERHDDPETLVIDVRPTSAYVKGHIPWAMNIPWKANLKADKTMKSADALIAHFESLGVTPEHNIVVHCQNGLASAHSYFALRLIGYPKVRTYHRSWVEWGAADDLPKAVTEAG